MHQNCAFFIQEILSDDDISVLERSDKTSEKQDVSTGKKFEKVSQKQIIDDSETLDDVIAVSKPVTG